MALTGYDTFADGLIDAANEQDSSGVHVRFACINATDGDPGIEAMLERILTEAAERLRSEEDPGDGTGFYGITAFGIAQTGDGPDTMTMQDLPSDIRWALNMIGARLNHDSDTVTALIEAARNTDTMPTCALTLAMVVGQLPTRIAWDTA